MKWHNSRSLVHPKTVWHRVPFALFPTAYGGTTYWLETPPYERKGEFYDGSEIGFWIWEYREIDK